MIGIRVNQPLQVALIDVGGTLWPNSWPLRETDGDGRHRRVAAALPNLSGDAVDALVTDLIQSSRLGDEARSVNTEHTVKVCTLTTPSRYPAGLTQSRPTFGPARML